jgi:hypothetical protein
VGLEYRDQPPSRKRLPRRGERGGKLGRVVSIVVHHGHSPELTQPLEPTPHSLEFPQRRSSRLERPIQRLHHRKCGHRVSQIVYSRHL